MRGLGTALRFAARDMRGGFRGFRIMVACLALGVAAIAGIGSLTSAVRDGLARDARLLLGGDLDIRTTFQPASDAQLAWMRDRARVSTAATMRAMAARADAPPDGAAPRAMVELKAVDSAYPLLGAVTLAPAGDLHRLLGRGPDGRYGAVVEGTLLARLGLAVGDTLRLGLTAFEIRAEVVDEPDKAAGAFKLGPRAFIPVETLAETGLIQPGSMVRWHYRLLYPPGTDGAAFEAALTEAFPYAGWRVRNVSEAAPRIQRHVDRASLFFTLVGLTALLVGGIGVAGAVKAHLDGKRDAIATLKCLGATGRFVFAAFGVQIAAMAVAGIALGLAAGALLPLLLVPALGPYLPVTPGFAVSPGALAAAAGYGAAVAALFTLWPLARAREVPAAALFRGLVSDAPFRPRAGTVAGLIAAAGAVAGLALGTAARPDFAAWFILGALIAFAVFGLAGIALRRAAAGWSRAVARGAHAWPRLQLALGNVARPGAPAQAIVVALGIALTVFVALAQVEGNFQRQVAERLPAAAPAYFFIDIQPDQLAAFEETVRAVPGTGGIERLPSLRGRIVGVNGTPIREANVAPGVRWALDGDRGITYARTMPDDSTLVAGSWWPADYAGEPLLSIDARIAEGLGARVGDAVTLNILGREISARIANTRHIDWGQLGLNFTLILSPGVLEGAPQTYIATVHATREAEGPLVRAVGARFGNVTAIGVREALDAVADALGKIGMAARATAGLALVAGVFVLAGAIAAGRRERTRDAVILKVTGARRRDLAVAYLVEYGLAGLAAAAVAAVLGTLAAFFVLTQVMDADWAFLPAPAAATIAGATLAVIGFGFAGTWRALSRRPGGVLRETATP